LAALSIQRKSCVSHRRLQIPLFEMRWKSRGAACRISALGWHIVRKTAASLAQYFVLSRASDKVLTPGIGRYISAPFRENRSEEEMVSLAPYSAALSIAAAWPFQRLGDWLRASVVMAEHRKTGEQGRSAALA
jgi:hypothetical protein